MGRKDGTRIYRWDGTSKGDGFRQKTRREDPSGYLCFSPGAAPVLSLPAHESCSKEQQSKETTSERAELRSFSAPRLPSFRIPQLLQLPPLPPRCKQGHRATHAGLGQRRLTALPAI